MNIKTLILARGGSKGIPGKNIIDINGKPLIQYTIDAAKASKANDVWVSTNCDKIASVAMQLGSNVVKRPENISGDKSKSEEALLHFASLQDFDILVFIQPTSPLIKSKYINQGLKMVLSGEYDSVFSVYEEHWIPRWNKDGTPDNWNISNRPMRQDIPKKYVENGAFYITSRELLLKNKNRYSGRIGMVEMAYSKSFQVDSFDDLLIIEKLLS
jgi:N-acylneuraminate cytidylyltransferase